jgi:predicted alpha/beta-fold hydrolase
VLGRIAGPTLVLHAADDPWIPVASHLSLPWPAAGNVSLLVSPGGGHVGFHDRASPIPWHDRCVALFIDFVDGSTTGDGASPGR